MKAHPARRPSAPEPATPQIQPQRERQQGDRVSPTIHDFSHVDLFSYAPQRVPIPNILQTKLGAAINHDPMLEVEADTLGAQVARGSQVTVVGQTTSVAPQLKRYKPGERMPFQYNGKTYGGLVVKVRKEAKSDEDVVYEVDTNMDGDQQSLVIQHGVVLSVESPSIPKVDNEVKEILDMPVRVVSKEEAKDGISEGDVLIGDGIVIKKPKVSDADKPTYAKAKASFLENVVRDLVIISTTKSGRSLLASIKSVIEETGKRVYIDVVDGYTSRSNAGQIGSGGEWDASTQQPGKAASAAVSYNPNVLGLPLAEGVDQEGAVALQDELLAPALQDEWGRPKNKPSDVTLFHEMVHADDILHGRLYTQETASGQFDKSKVSEMHAVGLEEYYDKNFIEGKTDAPSIYSENTYRHERGVAQRGWYKDPLEMEEADEKPPILEEDAVEKPILQEPKPAGFFSFKKTKQARKQQIALIKAQNEKARKHNERVKQIKAEQAVEENREALLKNTVQSNVKAQKAAKLDELVKSQEKGMKEKEKQIEVLEKEGESSKAKTTPPKKRKRRVGVTPREIAGKTVKNVDGTGMNCLINAILTAVGEHSEERVQRARNFLIKKGATKKGEMLELAGEAGALLIAYLRSEELIDADRGVRVYYYMGGDLVHQDVAPGSNPIQIFLNMTERHFYAVLD
ncbi:MAG: M91 family zinc metallopeptidase [Leptolyngbyaceae cyanobacterium bins.349]|nr:M91 family zinc metallopeptidase [Leptolyngbyaceae cyanobacterium bins.349]